MNNIEIKTLMKSKKIAYWKVADILGVSDLTIQRWLRHKQPQHEKELLKAIETIITEKKGE